MKSQRGFLMILAIAIVLLVAFIGVAASFMFTASMRSSADHLKSTQAVYLADSALEHATHKLLGPTIANRNACSGLSITNNAFGAGAYTVTSAGPFYTSATTTLNGALTAAATSITVASTANYQSSGRIMIDRELINYTAVDATHFLNATRGVDSSIAAAHVTAAPVGQYQCNLASTGAAPSLTAPANPGDPYGKRLLQDDVQLQEAWTVGVNNGNNLVFARWNNPAEDAWTNASVALAGARALNGLTMLSYVDAWAVGAVVGGNPVIEHWNGSAWSRVLPAVTVNAALNGVYCNATNDCWAVGANQGGNPLIERWNGTSWARVTPAVSVNTTLNSVYCNATNDCWAVGAVNSNNPLIEHWNGVNWTRFTPTVTVNGALNSVYCNATNDCWAVGAVVSSNPLIERWNGANWSRVLPSVNVNAALNTVACTSTSNCWAVGAALGSNEFFEQWNGTNWSRVLPAVTTNQSLFGVDCLNANDCWAVGAAAAFVHWDGASWVQVAPPSGVTTQLNEVVIIGPQSEPQSMWQEVFP